MAPQIPDGMVLIPKVIFTEPLQAALRAGLGQDISEHLRREGKGCVLLVLLPALIR